MEGIEMWVIQAMNFFFSDKSTQIYVAFLKLLHELESL
jgi:hypothetical protein